LTITPATMGPVEHEPPRPGEADVPAPGTAVEFCYRHPDQETRVHCTRCGRPICTDCMIPAPVGHQCPACVAEARKAFRMGPGRRARRLAATSVTTLMLVAIAAMFVVELVLSGGGAVGLQPSGQTLYDLGALHPRSIAAGQWWRLLTAMFLHASLIHILFNTWALYLFGQFVEAHFGRAMFLVIYFVSGFLASVTSYSFGPVCQVGVGASGAIVGLLGAFIVYNFRRRELALAQANLRWALTIIAINVVFGLAIANIDNWAHGGGLVAGMLVGAFAEGVGPREFRPASRVLGLLGLIGLGIVAMLLRTGAVADLPIIC
jgi:membrane associated rhomboid family serine protease